MRELYVISIELDETSIYFAKMNKAQASQMRQLLGRAGFQFSVEPVKQASGFNTYKQLMADFEDLTSRRG